MRVSLLQTALTLLLSSSLTRIHNRTIQHAVEHVESNYKSIRQEYFGAVLGQGTSTDPLSGEIAKPLEPDYDLANKGGEHADGALHTGKLRLILGLPCQFLRDFEIQPQLPSPPHTYRPMGVAQLHSVSLGAVFSFEHSCSRTDSSLH